MTMPNLPVSPSNPNSFRLLDPRIQRWIWQQGWTCLRDIQDQAIPLILTAQQDVILAAATASGKTEAAFLPILSHLLAQPHPSVVFYISPLKALINDQWKRLEELCADLDIPVVAWHGESNATQKQRFLKAPAGIVLITPESLEALFVHRGARLPQICAPLCYVVIDELHAFMGNERGQHLQSLLHRLECIANHRVPRIALSATLGDMQIAAQFLRPDAYAAVQIIQSQSSQHTLKILLKAYLEPADIAPAIEDHSHGSSAQQAIATHLYQVMHDSNNLIFPNSRRQVEQYAMLLRQHCRRERRPHVFWPHHGSLSRTLREESEQALKNSTSPATLICTTTLELGIDVGHVKAIAQIGTAPSVASLRQRLGRSGRRDGEAAILRAYAIEATLTPNATFSDLIREGLLHQMAMIRLLLDKWVEPPTAGGVHASTLVQQILSMIAEKGGCSTATLWHTLIASGVFTGIERDDYLTLLRHLGQLDVLMQDRQGVLFAGAKGERLLNHHHFYAAFTSPEEFRIEYQGRVLGSLPMSMPLQVDQHIIFAGKNWRVQQIDMDSRCIRVEHARGGKPPLFDSGGFQIHDRARQEVFDLLNDTAPVVFADSTAQDLLQQARDYFRAAQLAHRWLIDWEDTTILLTWQGDKLNHTLALLLNHVGLDADAQGVIVRVHHQQQCVFNALRQINDRGVPALPELLAHTHNLQQEKWDWALPDTLLYKSYASLHLDLPAAIRWIRSKICQ